MLGVINYGSGNYKSLCNALDYLGIPFQEVLRPSDFAGVEKLILPGVGAFNDCIGRLKNSNLFECIKNDLLVEEKPFLGICVGHQVLSSMGTEFENGEGLNVIPGTVVKLNYSKGFPVPHVGWAKVSKLKDSELFHGIEQEATFYFVHSYYFDATNEKDVLATVSHGKVVTAAVKYKNIYGVQFHPEKSQINGLKLLKNFSRLRN